MLNFKIIKVIYFLRSLPDPKYRCYANFYKVVSVVVVVALDLLNNDNNNHIKLQTDVFTNYLNSGPQNGSQK